MKSMTIQAKLTMTWLLSYISIASVSAAIITPALPDIEKSFQINTAALEWVVSIFLIGYLFGQLIYAPLANVSGRLKALKWGLNINILGLLLCLYASASTHYFLLLLGRLITGLGSAAGLPCIFMLINEWLPEEQRKTAMAYSIFSFALGIGFAVLIGGILTEYVHWQACFLFLLLQGILMRFGIRVFDETLTQSKSFHLPSLLRDYKQALLSFKLVSFSCVWGACSAVAYCYSAAAPQIAHSQLQLSASAYGYWNTVNIVGMLLGGLSARALMQRISVMQLISLGYVGSGLALLSLALMLYCQAQQVLWFFVSTSLLYCFSSYLFAGGSYMASNAIEDRASASSMMSFINMSIATISVVIMGYLSANAFYGFLGVLSSIFLGTYILFRVNKHE